jgi:iron complex transport system substrate-binding protein
LERFPTRIVCLTEEPTEVLYALGQEHRIVGISQFTVRPSQARKDKPRVSAFTSARIDRIMDLEPDLVVGFSDIQADIARQLIAAGVEVWISNHRSIEGILGYVRRLGGMVGAAESAEAYALSLEHHLEEIKQAASMLPVRPRVYFEEWNDPLITGIKWVSEVIDLAGGNDVFADKAESSLATGRIVADPQEVVDRKPDVMLASWCGKKFLPDTVPGRSGWDAVPAVATGQIHEIDSAIILQPGPAALTDGIDRIHQVIADWSRQQGH